MALGGGGKSGDDIRAGGAFVELFTKDSKLVSGLEAAKKRLTSFAVWTAGIGAAVAAAGTAILAPLGKLFWDSVDGAKSVKGLADKWGVAVEEMSLFAYAAKTAGADADALDGILNQFAKHVQEAASGTGELGEAFAAAGLDAAAMARMTPVEQMMQFADAMQRTASATERVALESKLGGRSLVEFDKLLRGGSAALRERMEQGKRLGAEVSADEAKAAGEISGAWKVASAAIGEAFGQLGDALLVPLAGPIKAVSDVIVEVAVAVREFTEGNQELVVTAAAVGAGLLAVGTALVTVAAVATGVSMVITGLGTAWAGLTAAFAAASAAVGLLLTPVGLIVAAVAAAGVAVAALFAFSPEARAAASELGLFGGAFESLKTTAVEAWGGIVAAFKKGDLSLAAEIAWAGVKAVWADAVVGLTKAWNTFKSYVVDGWHEIGAAGRTAIVAVTSFWEALAEGKNPIEASTKAIADLEATLKQEQGKRDAAREKDLASAEADARAAHAKLSELVAKANAPPAEKPRPGTRPGPPNGPQLDQAVSAATRGAFAAQNFAQALASPSFGIAKETLAATKKVAANTGGILAAMNEKKDGGDTWE